MYEGPLYALNKCSEGQTTLEEAKHLVLTAAALIQNAEQGHFVDTSVHRTFQRKAIQPGVIFDRVKAESKDMGEDLVSERRIRYCGGTSILLGLAAGPDKIMAELLLLLTKA